MPAPLIDDQDDRDDRSVEILSEVVLVYFKAEPANIGPFGASNLTWKVEGPGGFQVKLNLLPVTKTGGKVVQPASTSIYRLRAQAGQASKTLGQVTVNVDGTGCETFEPLLKPRVTFQAALKNGALNEPGISLRSQPSVSLTTGRISFGLRLSKQVDWFSDPDIDIDASFGLAVVDGELVATGETISVDASVPWYAWAAPGAIPGLAIALDMGKDSARKSAREAVQGLVELTNAVAMVPEGKRLRTVRIDGGNGGDGIIELTACPYDLLRTFAELSGVAVIR